MLSDGHHSDRNAVILKRVLPPEVAKTETSMLETVLQYGTAKAAAIGQFAAGKTGTTSNYGDAWFVGWDSKYTVAVWVGYPNSLVPMTTDFDGGPVLGGTFPALIWHDFMTSAMQVEKERAERGSGCQERQEPARRRSTATTGSQAETSGSTIETTATPPPAPPARRAAAAKQPKVRPRHTRHRRRRTRGSQRRNAEVRSHSGNAYADTGDPARDAAEPEVPANEAAPASKSGGTGATGGVSPGG